MGKNVIPKHGELVRATQGPGPTCPDSPQGWLGCILSKHRVSHFSDKFGGMVRAPGSRHQCCHGGEETGGTRKARRSRKAVTLEVACGADYTHMFQGLSKRGELLPSGQADVPRLLHPQQPAKAQ